MPDKLSLVGRRGLAMAVALGVGMAGSSLAADADREAAVLQSPGAKVSEGTPRALPSARRQKLSGYAAKFSRLQVLVPADDWVVAVRDGRVRVLSQGEKVGPSNQYHVEISEDSLHLVANGTGKRLVSIPLPSPSPSAVAMADGGEVAAGKGQELPPSGPGGVTIIDGARDKPAPVLPSAIGVKTVPDGGRPEETSFPNFRPPQVRVFDTPLGHAVEFLVRGSSLDVEVSPEDAAINIDQFQVNGSLPLVMKDLASKTSLFITRHGNSVVVSRTRSFLVVPDHSGDAKALISDLKALGAADIRETRDGIQFEADPPTAQRIAEWSQGRRSGRSSQKEL